MKLKYLLALPGALILSQCVNPDSAGADHSPRRHGYYDNFGGPTEDARIQRDLGLAHSDLQPDHAEAYRAGYSAGRRDKLDGLPRNERRAFQGWGGAEDSYFSDGYADGHNGNGMRH